jgi:hypothetical protein
MRTRIPRDVPGAAPLMVALAAVALLAWPAASPSAAALPAKQFDSPEQAVAALVVAVRAGGSAELLSIFGPAGKPLVESGDAVADKAGRARFAASFDEAHALVTQPDGRVTLVLGKDKWPFPIPLVKAGNAWHFDTTAGADEIVDRRIGRNELSAIEVCRAYVDAQREYASKDRNGDGILEYAQHFTSHPGRHDGLYWPAKPGEAQSPMGSLIARARDEGYENAGTRAKREPYHGYFYRILRRQGAHAPGGAHDYVVGDHMIGGFALVAFPAQYGASGVMTFIVNQDGVVFQNNLGPDTEKTARAMKEFDPDPSWKAD